MALRKRQPSLRLRKAEERLKSMRDIDGQHNRIINYGGSENPLTHNDMASKINECRALTGEYNRMLEEADKKAKELAIAEEELGNFFTRVLAGAKSIFGVDSDEVETLGGTKKSMRKKSAKNNNIQIYKNN